MCIPGRKTLRVHGQKEPPETGLARTRPLTGFLQEEEERAPREVSRGQTGSQRSSPHKAPPATGASHKAFTDWPSHLVFPSSSLAEGALGSGPDLVPTGTAAPPSAAAASTAASGGVTRRGSELVWRHLGGSGRCKGSAITPTSWLPKVCRGA